MIKDLAYFENVLNDNSLVYLNLPQGSGRTYILSSLYSKFKENSLFTYYGSHRTPMGEFLFTLLNLKGKKKILQEKGKTVGPILRRYIHPRFLKLLEDYKPQEVISLEKEISEIIEVIKLFLKDERIKYWFIDDWIDFNGYKYNSIFELLIPQISQDLGIHFFITGEALPNLPYFEINEKTPEIPITQKDFVIEEISEDFSLDIERAKELYLLSKGDWNNVILILRNNFKPLEEIIEEKINSLNEKEKKALYTFTLIGKTFSSVTVKTVKDLYTSLFFLKDFIDSKILRWEHPLWRFASKDVLRIIKEKISKEEYLELHNSFLNKIISYNYSDLWDRIAVLAYRINDEKRWLYAKLKEFRNSEGYHKKINVLKGIIERGFRKDLYIRKLVKLLIYIQKFSEALEYLELIKNKTLLDESYKIRCLSYLGKYKEAEEIIKEKFRKIPKIYELSEILSNIGSYYFLTRKSKEGIRLFTPYLRDITENLSSPIYLSNFYNSLAILNSIERRNMDAFHFYGISLEYARKSKDKLNLYKVMNNLGDLGRYTYGPKEAIKYNFEAYELSKSISENLSVISLSNIINSLSQYYPFEGIEIYTKEIESLISHIKVEYFLYIALRRLALLFLHYNKFQEIEKILPKLKEIKNISENLILIDILEGYLGKEINLEALEDKVLKTNEEQIIIPYLRLSFEKGFLPETILKEFFSDLPFYEFIKGLLKKENLLNLLTYIDLMLERWEFLDALNSYLLLINHLEKDPKEEFSHFIHKFYFESFSLSKLLKLDHIFKVLEEKIQRIYNFVIKKEMDLKVLETYLQTALINSSDEKQGIEIIYTALSNYLKNFLIRIKIGSETIEKGNYFLGEETLKLNYKKGAFSIYLYTKEEVDPYLLFVLKSFLNSFIVFWERIYGIYDPLTRLYNRSYGLKRLEEAYLDYKREQEKFSIIFLDVDSLKIINDTKGHFYGDSVLQNVSLAIKNSIRQNDYAIRWGGDEFLIILKKTDYESALKIAKRIEEKVKEISKGEVGISWGVETILSESETYEDLIRRADLKMYIKKASKLA